MTVEAGAGGPDDGRDVPKGGAEEGQAERTLSDIATELDERRAFLVDTLNKMLQVKNIDPNQLDTVISFQLSNKILPSLKDTLQQFGELYGVGNAQFENVVATFWLEFENHNIELLKKVAPDVDFQQMKPEELQRWVHEYSTTDDIETPEARWKAIAVNMAENYTLDINKVAESAIANRMLNSDDGVEEIEADAIEVHDDPQKKNALHRSFGSHVIDTLKLTVGVAGGIAAGLAADRWLRRRK